MDIIRIGSMDLNLNTLTHVLWQNEGDCSCYFMGGGEPLNLSGEDATALRAFLDAETERSQRSLLMAQQTQSDLAKLAAVGKNTAATSHSKVPQAVGGATRH